MLDDFFGFCGKLEEYVLQETGRVVCIYDGSEGTYDAHVKDEVPACTLDEEEFRSQINNRLTVDSPLDEWKKAFLADVLEFNANVAYLDIDHHGVFQGMYYWRAPDPKMTKWGRVP